MPTKTFPTKLAIAWLKKLVLPAIDRLEPNFLLADLEQVQSRIKELDEVICERCTTNEDAMLLTSISGAAAFTATSLACRVGRVKRFPRARSLANYWGLTPGSRSSGEKQRQGHITKAGSSMARWLLAQMTQRVLRFDARMTHNSSLSVAASRAACLDKTDLFHRYQSAPRTFIWRIGRPNVGNTDASWRLFQFASADATEAIFSKGELTAVEDRRGYGSSDIVWELWPRVFWPKAM